MMRRRLPLLFAGLLGLLALPATARAEEPQGESLREQVKKQMEKILRLMRENEKALLVVSAGGEGDPKAVEVPVPPAEAQESEKPESRSPSGSEGPAGSSEGASPGAKGDEIRRRLEEIVSTQGRRGSAIPRELENLVKMIPT